MLFCIIIKTVPQSCKISRDSCLMILNHFLWFYYNPEPLYFFQILFQTIRHWPKVSLLLIFFRCPAYSGGDLVAKSCLTLASPWTVRLLCSWDSPGKNTGVRCHFLPKGIFPNQGLNPGLLHCRQILYKLSH